MNGVWVDQIASRARRAPRSDASMLTLPKGKIRVRDVGRGERTIVLTPDAPVVLENYDALIALLAPHVRVVCFELPGCGFSHPSRAFDFSLPAYVEVVHGVLEALDVRRATLAFTCVNGLIATAVAKRHPERIERLALAQTPSLAETLAFGRRIDVHVAGVPLIATPVLGQVIMKAARRRIAEEWFRAALPKAFDHKTIWNVARPAYARGAQFCLASIMQGLMHTAAASDFADVSVPTQVTWGLAERTHKKTNKTSFRDHVPHAEMTELQERGHCLDIEDPAAHAARPLGVTQRGLSSLPTPVRRKP